MSSERILNCIQNISDEYIADAGKSHKRSYIRWIALAASLILMVSGVFAALPLLKTPIESESPSEEIGPSSIELDGITYIISPYLSMSKELPEGFAFKGSADISGMKDCKFYVSSSRPEWVYVYQMVRTDGSTDESGTLNTTEPHYEYVRYVSADIRGKEFISYHGRLYVSMWSAPLSLNEALYDDVKLQYGVRIEGEIPHGFMSAGIAEFSGLDTIPVGDLSCNTESAEVFFNPDDERVLLLPTTWYTAADENGEILHNGYNVYIIFEQ